MGSTAEAAKIIRDTLKAHGITPRAVSVRAEQYSQGSSIHVRIKDPAVSLARVDDIARQHERISYCSASGEILSGANRFVHIDYTEEAKRALAAPHLAALERLEDQPEHGATLTEIAPGYRAFAYGRGYVRILGPGGTSVINCWGRSFAAAQLGELITHGSIGRRR